MYVIIKIKNTNELLIVKSSWIEHFDNEAIVNYGINMSKRKTFTFFYSSFEEMDADFNAEIRNIYCPFGDYRYIGHLMTSFGKFSCLF